MAAPAILREAGSGAAVVPVRDSAKATMFAPVGIDTPSWLRTSLRSLRSMVGAPSKLPLVQRDVVLPRLLRTTLRSLRSTVPSSVASPMKPRWMSMKPGSWVVSRV